MVAIFVYGLVGICFVFAIVLFIGHAPTKQKNRGDYLSKITKFMDGRLEKIEGAEDDFRIIFNINNQELCFEDCKVVGFQEQVNHGFLRIKTDSKFTLNFSERKRNFRIKGDVFLASEVSVEKKGNNETVNVPQSLREFEVITNNVFATNQLLNDPKVSKIFTEFKNIDQRGYPFLALRVLDGVVVLQFQSVSRFKPSLMALIDNIALMEDYAAKVIIVAKKVNQIALNEH